MNEMNIYKLLLGLGLLIVVVVTPMYLRTILSGSSALDRAREARERDSFENSVREYRHAIAWRSPYNSASRLALDEMYDWISDEVSEPYYRLEALRQLRSGIMGSRNFLNYTSSGEHKDPVIAKLMLKVEAEIETLAKNPNAKPKTVVQSRYHENFEMQILAQLGFWGWIAGSIYFIFSAFDKRGRLVPNRVLLRVTPATISFVIWLFALSK